MWLLSFDPQQVCTVLQGSDTVQNNTVFTGAFTELEQVRRQTLRFQQLTVRLDYNVAVVDVFRTVNNVTVQEAVVLVTQVAWFVGYSDLL